VNRRALMFLTGLLAAALTTPARACSEPSVPYCTSKYGVFDDQDEFRRCKSEMKFYQIEAQDFLSCVKREADEVLSSLKRKSDRVMDAYNSAVESFNRRARG
jgi:hypothetical protein